MQPAQMDGLRRDHQAAPDQPQVVALPWTEHHAVLAETDGLAVPVDGGVADGQERHQSFGPADAPFGISSVQTVKLSKVLGPNVVVMATSDASRPRAIRIRPI